MKSIHYGDADSLAHTAVFPDFESAIRGKDVLDFGCGHGYQTLAIAKFGAKSVTGIEIDPGLLASAIARARNQHLRITFCSQLHDTYDLIYSQNSFEHFQDPDQICSDLITHLRPGGCIYITFAPPWLAPYGGHMAFFTWLPWVHLLFPERIVMSVRATYRKDGANTYSQCGLGKMTITRFEKTMRRTGLRMKFLRYDCIRGMHFLAHLPLLREFFVNRVSCILTRTD